MTRQDGEGSYEISQAVPNPIGTASTTIGNPDISKKMMEVTVSSNSSSLTVGKDTTDDDAESEILLRFSPTDPELASNWSTTRKLLIVIHSYIIIMNSTLGSSLPSAALPYIAADFNVPHSAALLTVSLYLIAHILSPSIWSPLSETYGRRPIILTAFAIFTTFTILCGVSPNIHALLAFRFFAGLGASAPISVSGGLYADLYSEAIPRGRVVGFMTAITTVGPVIGPIFSGRLAPIDWRWTFWVGGIIAGASALPLVLMPETYAPVLLAHKAKAMRKAGRTKVMAPIEMEQHDFQLIVTRTLTRPLRMLFTEPIVGFSSLFLAVCFGAYYLLFEAYDVIFRGGVYDLSPSVAGLTFIPIGIGAFLSAFALLLYDHILSVCKRRQQPWSLHPQSFRLPLAFIGGPMYAISIFWLAWTCRSNLSPLIPMSSGLFFGLGMELTYIALLNYLTDSYLTYAASAMAATNMLKSLLGAFMPMMAKPMYRGLGVEWATSILGFGCVALAVMPFVFYRYGEKIQERSKFCKEVLNEARKEGEKTKAEVNHAGDAV